MWGSIRRGGAVPTTAPLLTTDSCAAQSSAINEVEGQHSSMTSDNAPEVDEAIAPYSLLSDGIPESSSSITVSTESCTSITTATSTKEIAPSKSLNDSVGKSNLEDNSANQGSVSINKQQQTSKGAAENEEDNVFKNFESILQQVRPYPNTIQYGTSSRNVYHIK